MNFLHYEVELGSKDSVKVILTGNAANVLLLDESNFRNYQSGQQYQYFGGHYTRSPAILRPPNAGHWHVVVNLGGGAGSVNAVVQVVSRR
jgi:hypothetical protein